MLERAFDLEPCLQQATIWQCLAIILICLMLWIPILYTWEQIKFVGSFDWFLSFILKRKQRDALNRLKPEEVLYSVEPLGEKEKDK